MGERRQLINLACRMLGSLADAEDVVQETYARWYAQTQDQRDTIESPGAWLNKVASRLCLNVLTSARERRETYVGERIPEPLPEPAEWPGERSDPADRVTLDESVNMAFLVALDAMTPAVVASSAPCATRSRALSRSCGPWCASRAGWAT